MTPKYRHHKLLRCIGAAIVAASLGACGGGGGGGDSEPVATTPPPAPAPTPTPTPTPTPAPTPDPAPAPDPKPTADLLGLEKVSDQIWDEAAVRKVLDVFAFGGHALDSQITEWADLAPEEAIVEILTFDEHNLKVSPPAASDADNLHSRSGTLLDLAGFWASNDPENPVPESLRDTFDISNFTGWGEAVWSAAATSRGLNPVRHKLGLWETNYHMASGIGPVKNPQMFGYYDDVMTALTNGEPYQDVIGIGAMSAAIAMQYGHRNNQYRNAKCYCNEDFAREFYQLYFGIHGGADPAYHETTTIKNTANALTDMDVLQDPVAGFDADVTFGTEFHYPFTLEMLNLPIAGTDARSRLEQLTQIAIEHPESLERLPVMIVAGLADDNLDAAKKAQLRAAWASMSSKNLLTFLRAYAISTLFHSPNRVKYWSSIDRYMLLTNKVSIDNRDPALRVYGHMQYQYEFVHVFQPSHGVFGNQQGREAAASSDVFLTNYNRATDRGWLHRRASADIHGTTWTRDWRQFVPKNAAGEWVVADVADWLWQRYIADGLKHFGALERAHVYALLGSDYDLAFLLSPADEDRVITTLDLATDATLQGLVNDLAALPVELESADAATREEAGARVGQAINFIVGTPYIFAQEGR